MPCNGRQSNLWVIFAFQLIAGLLLLVNRYVPLAVAVLAPVIVNILSFHVLMAPSGLPLALVVPVPWAVIFLMYDRHLPDCSRPAPDQPGTSLGTTNGDYIATKKGIIGFLTGLANDAASDGSVNASGRRSRSHGRRLPRPRPDPSSSGRGEGDSP